MACDDGYAAEALVRATESADALRRVVELQSALIRRQETRIAELMAVARESLHGWEEERRELGTSQTQQNGFLRGSK